MMGQLSRRRFSIAGKGRLELDEQTKTKLIEMADRALNLFDKWIERRYPQQKEQQSEVWRKGDPLPEPQTVEEYRDFPREGPGRFQQAINSARHANPSSR